MTVLLSPVFNQTSFTDNIGNPANGGQIFAYQAGSFTTQQTIYSDSAGSVPITQPIQLDSAGRMPPGIQIWLTQGSAYQLVLRGPNGTIWKYFDQIQGILTNVDAAGVTSIIAGTNVTISPSGGTGAVTINASGGGGGGTLPSFQIYQNYQANYGNFPNTLNAGTNYTWAMCGVNASGGYTYLPGTENLYVNIPASGSVFTWDDTSNGSDTHPLTVPQGLYEITINFQLEGPENFPGNTTDGYFEIDWLADYTGTTYVYSGPIIQGTSNDAIRFSTTFQTYMGSGSGGTATCGPQFTVRYSNELNLYAFIEITMNITQLQSGTYPGQ